MENIKFIEKITDYVFNGLPRKIIGNCIYYELANGNRVKLWCYSSGVTAEVINKINGKIDSVEIPFGNYFKPTQCSSNAPTWTQHIDHGKWWFEDEYKHVLPTPDDYINLAKAIQEYIEMYK